jgi:predicted dehydrogenase
MTISRRYRAGIAGLGQVGLLFDEDPKRSGVWTHFTAYERLTERFDLVAACDPDADRRSRAIARKPSLRAYESLDAMLASEDLQIVSLCTPVALHATQIREAAGRVAAVICEKPLSTDFDAGRHAVTACERAGTLLAVNYYKRFDGVVPAAVDRVRAGAIGELRLVSALYAGPLDAVGSHALDLLTFFAGPLSFHSAMADVGRETAQFTSASGSVATLSCTGPRELLIFEVDLIGTTGRLRILQNGDQLEYSVFLPSGRYSGYQELEQRALPEIVPANRFLPLFVEVADTLDGRRRSLTSDGATALATQSLLDQVRAVVCEVRS